MGLFNRCTGVYCYDGVVTRCGLALEHFGSCQFETSIGVYYRRTDPRLGIGGAPSRATTLPADSTQRKDYPIATGFMDYFPDAIVELSRLSKLANDQHNPDKPMHWDRSKSQNEDDTMMRHFLQRGTRDTDGTRHSTRMAWRALAFLQKEIEGEGK